jgi:glycosyltransferase involved in cell wall biosynthesis
VRVVYLTQRLPHGDGETFIVPEIEALLATGHDVLVVPRQSDEPVLHDDVAAVLARTRRLPGRLTIAAAAAAALARRPGAVGASYWRLRATRPHRRALFNALATAEGAWLAELARSWRADHIHAHWANFTATMAMAASAASDIPWSFTAHRYDVVLNNLLDQKLRSARFGRFIAGPMLDLARRLVGSEAAARAIVLHMGVRVPPNPAPPVTRDTPVILCPARLVPVKGHGVLLEAAALLAARGTPFILELAGAGPEADGLAHRIRELNLGDRVRMLGRVPHAELLRRYREGEVDCVVLPSLDLGGGLHEGLSVGLAEAMAYGIPAVSTATGGQAELLDGAGLLVPPGRPDALAEALLEPIGSPARRSELGRAARRRIAEQFDVSVVARELARLFAGEPRTPRAPEPSALSAVAG